MHLPLFLSPVQEDVYVCLCEQYRENQVAYLSSQLTTVLWPCFLSLHFFSFALSLVLSLYTSLRGSTSINNPALSRHTRPSLCVHVCVRRGDLFAVHTKKLDRHVGTLLCLQTCANTALFEKNIEHVSVLMCVLPSGHWCWFLLLWVRCMGF